MLFDAGCTSTLDGLKPAIFAPGDCIYNVEYVQGYDVVTVGYDHGSKVPVYAAIHRLDKVMTLLKENALRIPRYRVGDIVRVRLAIVPDNADDMLANYREARITRVWPDGKGFAYDFELTTLTDKCTFQAAPPGEFPDTAEKSEVTLQP